MNSADLEREQAARLVERVRLQLVYLNKLCARIQKLRWPIDDPLSRAALTARNASQDLLTAARYAGMRQGIGKPSGSNGEPAAANRADATPTP